jgi:maleate isomerase
MRNDNHGDVARLGVFIVGAEPIPEAEWWAMAPPGVSVHAARVTVAGSPWASWSADRADVTLAEDVARGAAQFGPLRPHAVTLAHSSSSVLGGPGWDEATSARLAAALPAGTHVTTNGVDCRAALLASGVARPYLVLPTWFGEKTAAAVVAYFTGEGLDPAGALTPTLEPKWQATPPDRLYAEGMHLEQRPDNLRDQIAASCPSDADGVLIVGTGVRCVAIIDDLETTLGRPVVTANQAGLWRCLRLCGIAGGPEGYGALFGLPLG